MRSTTCFADQKPKERNFASVANNRTKKKKKKSFDLFSAKMG